MPDKKDGEAIVPFVPTTLYTTAEEKVEEEAKLEVAIPDPSPEEAAASIREAQND